MLADVLWRHGNWWKWCRRLVGLTLLSLFHQCLKAGFNSVFHLLQHLIRIEGWSRSAGVVTGVGGSVA